MDETFILTDCKHYSVDTSVCFSFGEPKGQCFHCGFKWYEHRIDALPWHEKASAIEIQQKHGYFDPKWKSITLWMPVSWIPKGDSTMRGAGIPDPDTRINCCFSSENKIKFSVNRHGFCLSKDLEWVHEPSPSNRTADFLSQCRFDTLEEAFEAFEKTLHP